MKIRCGVVMCIVATASLLFSGCGASSTRERDASASRQVPSWQTEARQQPATQRGANVVSQTYPCGSCGILRIDKAMPKQVQLNSPFDYTVNPSLSVSGDSAGMSWFGYSAATAIELAPGESVRFTETVFGGPAYEPPPATVPEPITMGALGAALLGLGGYLRKRCTI